MGTDDGLYFSIDAGIKWKKFDSQVFPTVSTKDLVIHPREDDLVIGTFGRAAWVMDDIKFLRAIAKNPQLLENESFILNPNSLFSGLSTTYWVPFWCRCII